MDDDSRKREKETSLSPPQVFSSISSSIQLSHAMMLQELAQVAVIRGDYRRGLEIAEEALKDMQKDLGDQHPQSLEMACMKAMCMAGASTATQESDDAESTCRETLNTITHRPVLAVMASSDRPRASPTFRGLPTGLGPTLGCHATRSEEPPRR
ncbi:hypothetical protein GGTG_12238 [Gaeumannomyces tritici R3-111a-1]|uniref:Kinesin light chain n=1 Tax=Gaeumannomyces tritici (strain R3-111a-1) TaxID=644352 RepID=J3PFG3_GAET3|nr:hypothetical protein GGTG_12238 [Gaeumannomyces tritici R3-111a-1]EJT70065.1 hypothetical protein GGTG_12238 [Gaeumannomyces tritici R3-111a-1]